MKQVNQKLVSILFFIFFVNLLSAQRLVPVVDTYIDMNTPTIAQGSSESKNVDKLIVRKLNMFERISFLEFKLDGIKQQVKGADLCLYLNFINNAPNTNETIDVYEVTSGELNDNLTWENFSSKYSLGEKPISTLEITTGDVVGNSYGWYKFDLKDFVNKFILLTNKVKNIKLALKSRTSNMVLIFNSSDNSVNSKNRPYLDIKP